MYELTNIGSESETLDTLVHYPQPHNNGVAFLGDGAAKTKTGATAGVDFSFPAAVHRLCDHFLPPTCSSTTSSSLSTMRLAAAQRRGYPHSPAPQSASSASRAAAVATAAAAASKRQKRAAFKLILDHRLTVPTQCFAMKTFIKGAFLNSFVRSCDVVIDATPPYQITTAASGFGGGGGKGLTASVFGAGDKAEKLAALFDELDRRYALLNEKKTEETDGAENCDEVINMAPKNDVMFDDDDDDKENAATPGGHQQASRRQQQQQQQRQQSQQYPLSASTVAKTLHLIALLRRRLDEVEGGGERRGGGGRGVEVVPYQIEFSTSSQSPFHRHFNVDIWLHERDYGRKWPSTTIHFG